MAESVEDLTALANPSFDEILEIIGRRFRQDTIYTFIGDILISVNPNKELPIYGPQVGSDYAVGLQTGQILRAHVFHVVNRTVTSLIRHQKPQCVILTGESGAGKTETVKMVVSQILRETEARQIHQKHDESLTIGTDIIQAVNLLDMFGCAVTPGNTNASRYSKLCQIFINEDGHISGARIITQGLDRSRVMFHEVGHTNYHVFHQLLAGLQRQQLQEYFINGPYRILETEENHGMFQSQESFLQYREDFIYLQHAMISLRLDLSSSQGGHSVIIGVLSAILNLGNIQFAADPNTDEAFVPNAEEVNCAAMLLGVPVGELMELLTTDTSHVRGDRVVRRNNFGDACTARNSLVRFLYSQLFEWIVQQTNAALESGINRERDLCLSVLDCPGYENLQRNCFEELCHNIADEKLQHHVNSVIFAEEHHDLAENDVRGYKAKFNDLTSVVQQLSYPRSRLLAIVDDESMVSARSAASLRHKLNKHLNKNKLFVQFESGKKPTTPTFGIYHTKGQVNYDVSLLLTKNRDKVTAHMYDVMTHSGNPLVAHLFSTCDEFHNNTYSPNQSKQNNNSSIESSRLSLYMESFEGLLDAIRGCEHHHIWCIKPNQTSQPNYFDPPYVFRQLTNIEEAVWQRKRGFPVRLTNEEFVQRYRFPTFPMTSEVRSVEGACHRILRARGQEGWMVGRTKVFLPLGCRETLDELMAMAETDVVIVQRVVRGFLARRRYGHIAQAQERQTLEVEQLADDIFKNGARAFYAQREQRDHARRKYDRHVNGHDPRDLRGSRSRRSRRYDRWGRPEDARSQFSGYSRTEVYDLDDVEDFQQRVLRSVIRRKEELDPATWCKIICMENEREVGKVYVQEKEVVVDGSYNKFDGHRLGLGVFQNTDRDEVTENIRGAIMEGVTLYKDSEGSIWAKRLSRYDVIVKGHDDPGNHCLSADLVLQNGHLPYQQQVKIFDAREFKSHVGLYIKGKRRGRLELLSLIGLSFIEDRPHDLDTPCWICVVNISALNDLQSSDVLQEVQMMIAGVHLKTEEETEEESMKMLVKSRHLRNSWSRTDQRGHLNARDSPRDVRERLRRRGENIANHMDYSWTRQPTATTGRMMTMEALQEMATQEQHDHHNDVSGSGDSRHRDWAKLRVTLKEVSAKQSEDDEHAQNVLYRKY